MLRSLLKIRLIDIQKTRNVFSNRFSLNDHHLLKTIDQFVRNENIKLEETELFKYHNEFKPINQTYALGLQDQCQCSLEVFCNPWGYSNLSSKSKNVLHSQFCGPSSYDLIETEFKKIINLYISIKVKGFNYSSRNGVLGGYYLHSLKKQKVFIVTQGNHRISVLKYLGYNYVPIYTMIGHLEHVHESKSNTWSEVAKGKCSHSDALTIFRCYFRNYDC